MVRRKLGGVVAILGFFLLKLGEDEDSLNLRKLQKIKQPEGGEGEPWPGSSVG